MSNVVHYVVLSEVCASYHRVQAQVFQSYSTQTWLSLPW